MTPEVTVDQDVCIGSGTCVQSTPDVFELNDEGVAQVKDAGAAGAAPLEDLQRAEDSCPVAAILVEGE